MQIKYLLIPGKTSDILNVGILNVSTLDREAKHFVL